MDPIRERALRRELRNAQHSGRDADAAEVRRLLGESDEPTNRGGATADRAPAKPRKKTAAKKDDAE